MTLEKLRELYLVGFCEGVARAPSTLVIGGEMQYAYEKGFKAGQEAYALAEREVVDVCTNGTERTKSEE